MNMLLLPSPASAGGVVRDDDCGACIDEECAIPATCSYHTYENMHRALAKCREAAA